MTDARSDARQSLQHFADAWLDGDRDAVTKTCAADIRWWTALAAPRGPAEVSHHLEDLLRDVERPVEVTGLLVDDEGSRGVIEMRSAPAGVGTHTALTSVLSLSGGRVTEGRTYVDTKAHPSLSGEHT
jgi:ketosteroid isomerase-like protein